MTNDKKVYKYPVFIRPKKPDITERVAEALRELSRTRCYISNSDMAANTVMSIEVNGKTIKEILEGYEKGER